MDEQRDVIAQPLTDAPSSPETEARVMKDIVRALLPDRHALGRVEGSYSIGRKGIHFDTTVIVAPDDADEHGARALTNALRPQLQEIADKYALAIEHAYSFDRAYTRGRNETVRDVLAIVATWSSVNDVEARELIGQLAELVRDEKPASDARDRDALVKELGDVLWYLAFLCEANGTTLEEVANANAAKLRARFPDGFTTTAANARADETAPPSFVVFVECVTCGYAPCMCDQP